MTMSESAIPSLNVPQSVLDAIGKHAIACYPEEACGLLVGAGATNTVLEFHATENVARSARVYTINPKQHMVIDRDAEDRGLEVVGVVHSHTHTEAYPSSTDVAQAPDPTWHYMIVTLKRGVPEPRNFRIINGVITETPINSHN
jgi:proteasome lid subunit RPN8/RPN11